MSSKTTRKLTPEKYLAQHPITLELLELGVTQEQLKGMRFRSRDILHEEFSTWSYTWLDGTPADAIYLIKPYCTLKWLTLENPPPSKNMEDAKRLVSETVATPLFELGLKHKGSQSSRAKYERGKINEKGETLNQLIGRLCLKRGNIEKSAASLWSDFLAMLDDKLMDPKETPHPKDSRKSVVEYNSGDGRKTISLGQFLNVVSDYRTGKRSA